MKLQQNTSDNRSAVEDAYRKLDVGLPPTDDADIEWQKMVRDEEAKAARRLLKQQVINTILSHFPSVSLYGNLAPRAVTI